MKNVTIKQADKICREEMEKRGILVFPVNENDETEHLFKSETEYKDVLKSVVYKFNQLGNEYNYNDYKKPKGYVFIYYIKHYCVGYTLSGKKFKNSIGYSFNSDSLIHTEQLRYPEKKGILYIYENLVSVEKVDWDESLRRYFNSSIFYDCSDEQEDEIVLKKGTKLEYPNQMIHNFGSSIGSYKELLKKSELWLKKQPFHVEQPKKRK